MPPVMLILGESIWRVVDDLRLSDTGAPLDITMILANPEPGPFHTVIKKIPCWFKYREYDII